MSILFDITSRQAKLLDFLSKTEEYLPAKQYADYLNVSERTIFNDLDKLEIFCKKYNLVIDKKQNQGIKLIGDTSSSNGFIQKVITNHKAKERDALSSLERQILIAKWLLINSQTVTYQSLSLDLYISSSSI